MCNKEFKMKHMTTYRLNEDGYKGVPVMERHFDEQANETRIKHINSDYKDEFLGFIDISFEDGDDEFSINRIEKAYRLDEDYVWKKIYKYNHGQLKNCFILDINNNVTEKFSFIKGKSKNKLYTMYNANKRISYEYKKDNTIIKTTDRIDTGDVIVETLKNNKFEDPISILKIFNDGLRIKYIYTYDENNNLDNQEVLVLYNNIVTNRNKFKYETVIMEK